MTEYPDAELTRSIIGAAFEVHKNPSVTICGHVWIVLDRQ
jgi:hypothetical protein